MDGQLIADIIVSLAAFCGLILLISVIKKSDPSSLSRRFLFGLRIVAAMLAARVIFWTTGIALFSKLTLFAAALIPLATILLTEGLLRMHAPRMVKWAIAGFTVLFLPAIFLPDGLVEPWRTGILMLAQTFGLSASAYLVVTRNRESLSTTENRVIERIALSLLLIIPFLVADYRVPGVDLPVRLGGVAILAMCWLAVSLERTHLSNRDMIRAFIVLLLGATLSGSALAYINNLSLEGHVQAVVVVLSVTMLAVLYNDTVALRFDSRRNSLLLHLANGDISSSTRFLQGLQNHVLVEGALILEQSDLKDFDLKLLKEIFSDNPIQRLSDLSLGKVPVADRREQLDWLFERFNSTHVIIASDNPVVLVALNMPSLSSSAGAETELMVVQRMALLVSRLETAK